MAKKLKTIIKCCSLLILSLVCCFWLFNLSFGIAEPIPDIVPVIGHLDELIELIILYFSGRSLLKMFLKAIKKDHYIDVNQQVQDRDAIPVESEVVDSSIDS
ncbi:MAG: hypothetical protein HRT89_06110 [Lentisphaeria bacterium]|nr:hypothetical protein [Lentisphaeria bacterium]NQZ67626.1 hypothetical protein [Lentisphaeria bacterium]